MAKEDLNNVFDIDEDFDDILESIDGIKDTSNSKKLNKKVDKLGTTLEESKEIYKETSLLLQEKRELSTEIKSNYETAKDRYREDMEDLSLNMKNIYNKSFKVINRIDEELDDGPLNSKMIEAFAKTIDAINKLFDNVRATNEDVMRFEERRAVDSGEIGPQLGDMEGGTVNITQIGELNLTSSEMLAKFKELQEVSIENTSFTDAEIN